MIQNEFEKTYISSATTTIPFTGKGILHNIVIGTTAAGTITIKDGTTTIQVLKSSIAEGTYWFDVAIADGLSIVTAAASKITVTWQK